ncbi:hypothetical protein F4778DRAFT_779323 [Xylariomycetidae sp. FL2044]|nr:hypothetical protein F4778DRAFT_779323 [Xylariomycetidae sp. FL2044]
MDGSGTLDRQSPPIDGIEDQRLWQEFFKYMKGQADERPYPEHLYRSHVHGHPFQRRLDEWSGTYIDSFGSDSHLWLEDDTESQIDSAVPLDHIEIVDLFRILAAHLNKTQLHKQQEQEGEDIFLSSLVSLSGDFRWTMQRTCKVGRSTTTADQSPGLAIFDTAMIKLNDNHIWRVGDMIKFLDSRASDIPITIDRTLRRWATNSDEYVCWDLIPLEALVSFTPLSVLAPISPQGFLTWKFVGSNFLGDFRNWHPEDLSLEQYAQRLCVFLGSIFENFAHDANLHDANFEKLIYSFRDPLDWGYNVPCFSEDFDETVLPQIKKELEEGLAKWRSARCEEDVKLENRMASLSI